MGAIGEAIFGKKKQKVEQTIKTEVPQYQEDVQKDILNRGTRLADRQYRGYEGDRVAGLSANEATAENLAADAVANNDARRNLAAAEGQVDALAGNEFQWDEATRDKYMNPYIDAVIDPQAARLKTEASQQLANLRAKSVSTGAFGSERQTMLEGQIDKNLKGATSELYSKGRAAAYDQALNTAIKTWGMDNQRKLQAAEAYQSVGGDISRLNSAQITDLIKTGQTGRMLEQAELDFDYDQFLEERDWEPNNLQTLIRSLDAVKGTVSTQSSSGTAPRADTTGSIIGAAATVAGYFGNSWWGGGGGGKGSAGGGTNYADQAVGPGG